MKNSSRIRQIGVVSLMILMLGACAGQKVPAERLLAEIQATVTAASTEAAKYIPDQLAAVQTQLVALQASFDKKDYAAVLTGAQAVRGAAQSLATDAATKKDEVLKALNDKWTALAGSDVDGAKSALGDAMSLWSKAQAAFASGNMDEAVNTAQGVKSKVDAVAAALKLDLAAPTAKS